MKAHLYRIAGTKWFCNHCGKDARGENALGKLLMEVRAELG